MELKNFFAQDDQGNALPEATCYLYVRGTETLVPEIRSVNGQLLSNPFQADQAGLIQFAAANGLYDLRVVKGQRDNRIRVQCNDVTDTLALATDEADRAAEEAQKVVVISEALGKFEQAGVGSVVRPTQDKIREVVSPEDKGAVGGGVVNDTAAFAALEATFAGHTVNLKGRTYRVDAIPSANLYVNGFFQVGEEKFDAFQDSATLASETSTGGIEDAYTGGANDTPTWRGRSTKYNRVLIACSNSVVDFVRGVAAGCIYTRVKANVGFAAAARQCFVNGPQASIISSEEGQSYGFRAINWATAFCIATGSTIGNILSRNGRASGTLSGTIATETCQIGGGKNAYFEVVVTDGVPTINILKPGIGFNPTTDKLLLSDRSSKGVGAGEILYSVDSAGSITGITQQPGGAGYSENTEVVMTCGVSTSIVMSSTNSKVSAGANNLVAASTNGEASGSQSGVIFSESSKATGGRSSCISTTSGVAAGQGACVLGGNIAQALGDQSILLGARRAVNTMERSVGSGNALTGSASPANMTWRFNNANGNATIAGYLQQAAVFTDIAKMFENDTYGEIPVGAMVTLVGRKIRLAVAGDTYFSAHSRHFVQLLGGDEFTWAHRWLTDHFGEKILIDVECVAWPEKYEGNEMIDPGYSGTVAEAYELFDAIPDEAVYSTVKAPVENPEFKATLAENHSSRLDRRNEWTPVALVGEVHIRVDETVIENEHVAPGNVPGVGTRSINGLRCMEIRKSYDAQLGYAIALCLVA